MHCFEITINQIDDRIIRPNCPGDWMHRMLLISDVYITRAMLFTVIDKIGH